MQYLFDDTDYLNDNPAVQEQKDVEFRKRCAEYHKRFAILKDKLPKRFISLYEVDEFHDYWIENIRFVSQKQRNDLIVQLSYFDEYYEISYEHVDNVKMDLHGEYIMCIIFNELLDIENGLFSNEFFLMNDKPSSIYFTFKRLRLKKIRT